MIWGSSNVGLPQILFARKEGVRGVRMARVTKSLPENKLGPPNAIPPISPSSHSSPSSPNSPFTDPSVALRQLLLGEAAERNFDHPSQPPLSEGRCTWWGFRRLESVSTFQLHKRACGPVLPRPPQGGRLASTALLFLRQRCCISSTLRGLNALKDFKDLRGAVVGRHRKVGKCADLPTTQNGPWPQFSIFHFQFSTLYLVF